MPANIAATQTTIDIRRPRRPTVVVLPLTSTLLDVPLVRVTIEPLPATGLQQPSQR